MFGPRQTLWKRHQRFCIDGTWDKIHAGWADADGEVDWNVSVDSTINRAHQHATTLSWVEQPAGPRPTVGLESSDKDLRAVPPDHALGHSRGEMSTKVHQLVDSRGRPLVITVTPGQSGDSSILIALLTHLSITRPGPVGRRPVQMR